MKKVLITILIVVLLIGAILLYSRYVGTSSIIVKEYKVVNENIKEDLYGLKIVHISDIHYGRTVDSEKLKKIVSKVNLINPDIVVITGDLLDKSIKLTEKDKENLINFLNSINSKYNNYIISGDHDIANKVFDDIVSESEFINLNDNYDYIYGNSGNKILIYGLSSVDDNIDLSSKLESLNTIENEEDLYKVLLAHEPDVVSKFNYNDFNLILAGHSHNGQVRVPYLGAIILPENAKKYYDEYYDLNGTDLYISSGLGTSNFDFRLFNRPSISLYRLTNK